MSTLSRWPPDEMVVTDANRPSGLFAAFNPTACRFHNT